MRFVPQVKFGFAARVAAFYAALFVTAGIQLPFFPVWLKDKGLDPIAIGLVLAMPTIVRNIAVPPASRIADRRNALRASLIVLSCGTMIGYALLGLAEGPLTILLAYALASVAYTPVMPLMETYALKGLSARGRAYGPVRLWGSASFIIGSFAAGFALDIVPARQLIWMMVAGTLFVVFAAFALLPLPPSAGTVDELQTQHRGLLRNRTFIALLAAASLIQSSHAVYYGFSALQWRAAGLDGTAIAALWALGVVAEIVLFALQGRLPPFLSPAILVMIGAAGCVLRWTAMALDPPLVALPFLQLLHALSFGATHLGALGFVVHNTPPGRSATAQGYLAIAVGTAMAGAMAISGVLVDIFGSSAYAAMTLLAIAGGVCGYIAQTTRRVAVF
jgi:MFS transporter, PPP family, 3-phenylpropionic acid transporter